MGTQTNNRVDKALAARQGRVGESVIFLLAGALLVFSIAIGLHQRGIAATHTEQVLDCHYVGSGAHTHDNSCYDANGILVCPLEERAYHQHDESCYTETRELVCGLEESEGHTHTDACFDEEGNLICGLEESEGHTHTDACYQVTRELTCGKQETFETHVHGPGCFREVTVQDSDNTTDNANTGTPSDGSADDKATNVDEQRAGEFPAQTFTQEFKDDDDTFVLRVDVDAPEGTLPAGVTMRATLIEPEDITKKQQKAVDSALARKVDGKVLDQLAVDIAFCDADGQEIEPSKKVTVTLTSPLVDTQDEATVVHVDDLTERQLVAQQKALDSGKTPEQAEPKRTAEAVDALSDRELAKRDLSLDDNQLSFDSDQFSLYVLAVTSLQQTLEASDGNSYTVTVEAPADASVPTEATLKVSEILPEAAADTQDAEPANSSASLTYEEYVQKTKEALGCTDEDLANIRLFDIKIVNAEGEKIDITAPVDVNIALVGQTLGQDTQVVHFADGAQRGDVVSGVETDGTAVSFAAEGFSAYAITDGPVAAELGWSKVTSLDDLNDTGFYIGHVDGYYLKGTIETDGDGRTGIAKTKPASTTPVTGDGKAVLYYFERIGATNQFYVYCKDGDTKKYVYNDGTNSLSFTTDESQKTAFDVSVNGSGVFEIKNDVWYWNMQSGANGTRFCSYNQSDANTKLYIWNQWKEVTEDPYGLDGQSHGLLSWSGGVTGKALMAEPASDSALVAKHLTVLAKTNQHTDRLFVPKNENDEITFWEFEWKNDNFYYLKANTAEGAKYLTITASGVSLSDTPSKIQVVPGTGTHKGEICLKSEDGKTLAYSGNVDTGFVVGGSAGSEWLHFAEESNLTDEYFKTYSAQKVSVSDTAHVTNGSQLIIYTRFWNESKKRYDFYAVNKDGKLVPAFESGDSIEWIGNNTNEMLWQLTEYTGEDEGYFDLFNPASGLYIAPKMPDPDVAGDDGQILSPNSGKLILDGRRKGKYYTTILSWDPERYVYAGLKVEREDDNSDSNVIICPRTDAMDFYVAIMEDVPTDDTLHTFATIDNTLHGITMKMANFNNATASGGGTVNSNPIAGDMNKFLGSSYGGFVDHTKPGLLSTSLGDDGYPTVTDGDHAGQSLADLYGDTSSQLQTVNHLFIQSTYDASGYYEFNSAQNYASLYRDTDGDGKPDGYEDDDEDGISDFKVYKELGSNDSGGNKWTLKHGQFFPYNDLKAGLFGTVNGQNLYPPTPEQQLDNKDPRKYEQLYLVPKPDYYFGMELEANFVQTPNGLDDWDHDIIFEFSGDDDFWLYVDGELVIDLGGIHSALPGSVNFRTGKVMVNGTETTLKDLFYKNYVARDHTDAEAQAYVDSKFEMKNVEGEPEPCYVFKDNTQHTMRIFYMERGAGASNLHMRFNLSSAEKGTVQLTKKLTGVNTSSALGKFAYQIQYKDDQGGWHNLTNQVADDPNRIKNYVVYKGTDTPLEYHKTLTIEDVTYEDVFLLEPDQGNKDDSITAVITLPDGPAEYRIIECGVNTDVISGVKEYSKQYPDGHELSPTTEYASGYTYEENRSDFAIDEQSSDDRPTVLYENEVKETQTLTIEKRIYDPEGRLLSYDPERPDTTTFDFNLYYKTELEGEDDPWHPAEFYPFHVKNPDGVYCKWNDSHDKFIPIKYDGDGVTNFDNLTPDDKVAATFDVRALDGSITHIPAYYTVELCDLLIGTKFKVVEYASRTPDGYKFREYQWQYRDDAELTVANASQNEGIAQTIIADTRDANDAVTKQNDLDLKVCNTKGYGLRLNKIWKDADTITRRDPAYFAVYYCPDGSEPVLVGTPTSTLTSTVRQLPYGADPQTLYWYFETLPDVDGDGTENEAFSDFWVYEVTVDGAFDVDDDGVVTVTNADDVKRILDGAYVELNGKKVGESDESAISYKVTYDDQPETVDDNVRKFKATNEPNSPSIIIRKQDWSDNWLADAKFKIVRTGGGEGTVIGTYISKGDEDGGYVYELFPADGVQYTLEELAAPQGYQGLQTPLTMSINYSTGEVTVTGGESDYYDLYQRGEYPGNGGGVDAPDDTPVDTPATLIVKDRPYHFEAIKKDGVSGQPMAGVNFTLNQQTTVGETTSYTKYADLTTDSAGKLKYATGNKYLDESLPAGSYELIETAETAPAGYQPMARIYFTVNPTGTITPTTGHTMPQGVTLVGTTEGTGEQAGELVYTLTIPNTPKPLKLRKTDEYGVRELKGAKFSLSVRDESSWASVSGYEEIDMTSVSVIELKGLPAGLYKLTETLAPDGYVILARDIFFRIKADRTVVLTDEAGTGSNTNDAVSIEPDSSDTGTYVITVMNQPGAALPSVGGLGTTRLMALGSLLLVLASAGLVARRMKRQDVV